MFFSFGKSRRLQRHYVIIKSRKRKTFISTRVHLSCLWTSQYRHRQPSLGCKTNQSYYRKSKTTTTTTRKQEKKIVCCLFCSLIFFLAGDEEEKESRSSYGYLETTSIAFSIGKNSVVSFQKKNETTGRCKLWAATSFSRTPDDEKPNRRNEGAAELTKHRRRLYTTVEC